MSEYMYNHFINNSSNEIIWTGHPVAVSAVQPVFPREVFWTTAPTFVSRIQGVEEPPAGCTFKELCAYLLETGNYSDSFFNLIDHQLKIPIHSFLFLSRSRLFRDTFFQPRETIFEMPVTNVTVEGFRGFINMMYHNPKEMKLEVLIEVLYVAFIYRVDDVVALCASSVRSCVKVDNVLRILMVAISCEQVDLQHASLEFVSQNASLVFHHAEFFTVTADVIETLLKQDGLKIDERDLFSCLLRWVDAELRRRKISPQDYNRRQILNPWMHYIRFPLMGYDHLYQVVGPMNLLAEQELSDLLYFVRGEANSMSGPLRFDSCPRTAKYVAYLYSDICERAPSDYLSSSGEKHVFLEEFRFEIDYDINLVGVALFGPGMVHNLTERIPGVEYDITFRITGENRQQNTVTSYEIPAVANSDFNIMLGTPYPISKNCVYHVSLEIAGFRTRFGLHKTGIAEMSMCRGQFATVKFYERQDLKGFCHSGIVRGLIFELPAQV